MTLIVIIAYIILIIYEFIPLYKEKQWIDFGVNGLLTGVSFLMAVLLSLDVKIPSPLKPIEDLIISIFGK